MKLLIFTTQDKFFRSHIYDRALYFLKRNWEVGVVFQVTDPLLIGELEKKGIKVFNSKIERKSINPVYELLSILRVISIYRAFSPDIVWHLGAKAIFYGTLAAKLLRLTKLVGIVNAPIGLGYVYASKSLKALLLRPLLNILYKYLLNPSFSRIIIENTDDINDFVRKGFLNAKDAFCVLGAGVDTEQFVPLTRVGREVCVVVMAARLIKEKGVHDFITAAESLYRENLPVRMLLVGEPDYGNPSSVTEQEYEKIKQNPAVECLGFRSDMAIVLGQADVFCLPSFYREGLPRVLIEAASCGLPIITTDTVGCRESVRNKNGFLLPPRNVESLIRAIKYLVLNSEERRQMGKNSREVAINYFDTKKICKRHYEIFNSLWLEINKK